MEKPQRESPIMPKILLRLVTVLIIIAIGWGVYHYWEKLFGEKAAGISMPPVVVTVATPKEQQWYDQIKATGTMSAFQGIMVKPEVAGQITKILFQSGTYVEKGTPLIQIYPDIIRAQVERYKAALQLAQLDYARGKTLYEKNVISRQTFDTLTSNLQQDQANVAQAQAQLVQYNIVAAFSGMLGLKQVDVGDYVSAGEPLVLLQQVTPIRVEFTVPEVYLNKLSLGQMVEIIPSYNPAATIQGKVYAFNSAINTDTRTLEIWAQVPNQDRKLMPGMFVEVTLYAGEQRKVLTLPQTTLVYSPQGLFVYRVVDGKAVKSPVTIGLRKGGEIEIKTGISPTDVVVTAGQIKLVNEAPVIVNKEPDASTAKPAEPAAKGSATQATSADPKNK